MKNGVNYPQLGWAALKERDGRRRTGCLGGATKGAVGVAIVLLMYLLAGVL